MMKFVRNEKGIALVSVLILSLIALSIIATLVYLVIQGTRFSGFFKRYETVREAGTGGAEITVELINSRGRLPVISDLGLTGFTNVCDCGDPDVAGDNIFSGGTAIPAGDPYECICAKLCDATADWPTACDNTLAAATNPDLSMSLAGIGGDSYSVNTKIVDTIPGYTDMSGDELGGTGVVTSSSLTLRAPPQPYIYRVEVDAQNATNLERSTISVLYGY
jgi:Flp pilus assembly pilin Flp